MLLGITSKEIELAGIYLVSLVLSIAVHEYGHAWAASRLGDRTPESEGRLSLNPVVHADPIGTLLLPVVAAFTALPVLGWGKPVPTYPPNYTRRVSMRVGMGFVAFAGPFFNLLFAAFILLVAGLCNLAGVLQPVAVVLLTLVQLNLVLMVFNFLPVHPLDGGKILAAVLPTRLEWVNEWLAQYGWAIILVLMVAGGGIIATLVSPFHTAAGWAWDWVMGVTA